MYDYSQLSDFYGHVTFISALCTDVPQAKFNPYILQTCEDNIHFTNCSVTEPLRSNLQIKTTNSQKNWD